MKKLLLFIILILSNAAYSQKENRFVYIKDHVMTKDTLFIKGGGIIVRKGDLKLGKGSDDNGTFRFIQVNEASMFRGVSAGGTHYGIQEANAMPNKYNGLKAKVINIEERGNRKTGFKAFVIIAVGDVRRYQVDLDSAIEYGEIIVDGNEKNKPKNTTASTSSLADEIKKLNELKESGLLTEEEYRKAKTKLLE